MQVKTMRLLYGDNLLCSPSTMKRLMVIANEIGFLDRPAVMGKAIGGGQWGLIGAPTPIRQYTTDEAAVKWTAFEPAPELSRPEAYQSFVEADFNNPRYMTLILDGLKDDAFSEKFIQPLANYGEGKTGESIRRAILNDPTLRTNSFTPDINGSQMFAIETPEGRANTLKLIGVEASVRLTATLLNSEHYGIPPVSDDAIFAKLLAMRSSSVAYVGGTARLAPFLGLQLVSAVIPDDVLQKLGIEEIDSYRKASADAYAAWATEINRASSKINDIDPSVADTAISKIIAEDLVPKLLECKSEMISVRDKLFGDLIKAFSKVHYQLPALSVAYITHDFLAIMASVVGSYAPAVAPAISDYIQDHRAAKRKNSMSYLVGLTKRVRN